MKTHLRLILSGALALTVSQGHAQTAAVTDPVGFVNVAVPAQSDVAIGAPVHRASVYQGRVKTVGNNTLTVVGSPGWAANAFQFVSGSQTTTYFVRLDSGPREGMWSTITANGANTLTVDLAGESYSGVRSDDVEGLEAGDLISIIPHWTPATLIGTVPNGTQLQLFRPTTGGTNVAPTRIISFNATSGNWIVGFNTVANHDPLFPGEGMVLRNTSTNPITVALTGSVPMTRHRSLVRTLVANTDRDQRVTYQGAVPEKIGAILSGFTHGDQLLFYNNAATGFNKAPVTILSWRSSDAKWIQGFSTVVSDTFDVVPGTSFTYRKRTTGAPAAFVWQDLPGYLNP